MLGKFEWPGWLLVAGREFVGAFGVIHVADSVASSEHPDARDPAVVLIGLIDAPHYPVVKVSRTDAKLAAVADEDGLVVGHQVAEAVLADQTQRHVKRSEQRDEPEQTDTPGESSESEQRTGCHSSQPR